MAINNSLVKNPMPSLDADVRNKNFEEVALGYTVEQAIDEAERSPTPGVHPNSYPLSQ